MTPASVQRCYIEVEPAQTPLKRPRPFRDDNAKRSALVAALAAHLDDAIRSARAGHAVIGMIVSKETPWWL